MRKRPVSLCYAAMATTLKWRWRVVALMAEPSVCIDLTHTGTVRHALLVSTHTPTTHTHIHMNSQSDSQHTAGCFLPHIISALSTLQMMHSYKSQEMLQSCKHADNFALYICTHDEKISRYNAACAWPSFSEMHRWVVLLPLSASCPLALQFLNALSTLRVLLLLLLL